jgi:hypothetical protein
MTTTSPARQLQKPTRRTDLNPVGLYGLTRIFLQMMIRLATRASDDPDRSSTRTAYGFRSTGPILTEGEIEVYSLLLQRSSPAFGLSTSWAPRMERDALILNYIHMAWLQCIVPLALSAALRDFRMTPFAFNTRDDTTLVGSEVTDRALTWHEGEGTPHLNNRDPARLVQKLFLALLDVSIYDLVVDADELDMHEVFGDDFEDVDCHNYARWIGSDPDPIIVFGQRWVARTHIATPSARDLSVGNSSLHGDEDDSDADPDAPGADHDAPVVNDHDDSSNNTTLVGGTSSTHDEIIPDDDDALFNLILPNESDFSGDDGDVTQCAAPISQ